MNAKLRVKATTLGCVLQRVRLAARPAVSLAALPFIGIVKWRPSEMSNSRGDNTTTALECAALDGKRKYYPGSGNIKDDFITSWSSEGQLSSFHWSISPQRSALETSARRNLSEILHQLAPRSWILALRHTNRSMEQK
ncbi:hypothetical protein CY34DRAFT_810587 [Suillus luteus UH-Slu-Lm8-n1]|uniref:Uncharacterized protein n=1 Tax=Suillus luteus UH-Slu-Lm8-n1 TaxID=930992 RepID=A0A0D0AZ98_9AGAM|nr:hypothetical protein CY34DRAFT_810587 [Suillus luteus UH-Slu-Lm8-n1]